jgi:hypothetical protein
MSTPRALIDRLKKFRSRQFFIAFGGDRGVVTHVDTQARAIDGKGEALR